MKNDIPCSQSITNDSAEQNYPLITAADILVAYLEQLGIEYVFGVPGGAIEPFFNAMARSSRRGGLKFIMARHESGAAFMADGYTRETGKIGVCCATAGPGATNLITGVACAYANNIPMLVLTGQPPLIDFGRNPLQNSSCTGVNILGMFEHCTRFNTLVSHPKQLEQKLMTALHHATGIHKGPVHLTIPVDVLRSENTLPAPSYDLKALLHTPSLMMDKETVDALSHRLSRSKKIVLLLGGGCEQGINAILQFAALHRITFVTTADGKGLINPRHPLFRGVFGFGGHDAATAAIEDPDVDTIVAVGVSLGEWNSGGWNEILLSRRLVHIDEIEDNLVRTPMASLHVRGRIKAIFNRLLQETDTGAKQKYNQWLSEKENRKDWTPTALLEAPAQYESNATPIKPQRLMKELGQLFPLGTCFIADASSSYFWATHYLYPQDRRMGEQRLDNGARQISLGRRRRNAGWLRIITEFEPMGWAIGSAVGTAVANRDIPVVCITGDGSMLMNGQEISAAVAENLTIIFVLLNNGVHGMVKHGQILGGAERIAFELPPTDFAAIGKALGAETYTIHTPDDFKSIDIAAICRRKGPTLFDVRIDPDEIPPIGQRVKTLSHV